ncbi:tetratricopeptide repeat protein [Parerythrobacter jejuensis]|uniref:Tetratricopeptide repeat protein n=1 Tax=Parerythrobacter jejuensis TaxID=795812 RepID=A0A845AST0_9SPHN|nr:hypothetical protein [Parerythrobacter jejuensis]MXP32549.1 hypothetical protein [Parerythrobacter jejuensis]
MPILALAPFLVLAPLAGQNGDPKPPTAEEAARERPIVVTGQREEERVGVQSDSRIRKKPRFTNENIRSATGIAGLSPGSGMRPLSGRNPVFKKRIIQCVSDNEAIGERATCLLANAQEDVAAGNIGLGADAYRYLVSSDEFAATERLAGGQKLYALGEETGNDGMREEALIRLVESDTLPANQARSARRTLVAMALKQDDTVLAIDRLEDVVAADPADAQSLANLAILLRREGRSGASDRMRQAIAAIEQSGQPAPQAWTDFAEASE